MTPRPTIDRRVLGLALTLALVFGGGAWVASLPAPHAAIAPDREDTGQALRRLFDQAVVQLHARQYGPAHASLREVLALAPAMPEAHVNLGFALLGLQKAPEARRAFETAIDLRPDQANAYYGLALSHEAAQDLELAIGSMRSYLHLARQEDAAHLARARAALWEWESALAQRRAVARP